MEPNHICKYSGCTLGEGGGRKHYYACGWCDRTGNWRSMACCAGHYTLYMQEVALARSELPERTDMSSAGVAALMATPLEQVEAETLAELREHEDLIRQGGISAAVDHINGR